MERDTIFSSFKTVHLLFLQEFEHTDYESEELTFTANQMLEEFFTEYSGIEIVYRGFSTLVWHLCLV